MRTTKRSARTSTIPDPTQLEKQIRLRAYALYESRGCEVGHELDDWLQAEAEILGRQEGASAA
ncbi:MAG: DUF2934 domain-containing protein [Acidobacteriia bacterium]|nr:DUF2934 domain-containing protein [Terriglobia bacterium]